MDLGVWESGNREERSGRRCQFQLRTRRDRRRQSDLTVLEKNSFDNCTPRVPFLLPALLRRRTRVTHRDRKIDGGTTSCESGVQSGEEVGFEEDGLEFRGREEGEDGVNEDRRGEDVHLMEEPINEGNVREERGEKKDKEAKGPTKKKSITTSFPFRPVLPARRAPKSMSSSDRAVSQSGGEVERSQRDTRRRSSSAFAPSRASI